MNENALPLSHLDKLYWKEDKISKGALIQYYADIAPYIMPYLKDRPLVLHRFPGGVGAGGDFYQKESGTHLPPFVKTCPIQHENKVIHYILVQNVETLLYVVNLGSIELHPFNARFDSAHNPDYMVIDLDAGDIDFRYVIDTALVIHDILQRAKTPHFCKTSGKRGLHIYVPIENSYDSDQVRQMAFLLATLAHKELPKVTSLERSPEKRKDKVYIDYLQNRRLQTMVCAYSVRGAEHPTVSTPLHWDEVKHGLDPQKFTIDTLPKRLKKMGDLFKGVLKNKTDLQDLLNQLELMSD